MVLSSGELLGGELAEDVVLDRGDIERAEHPVTVRGDTNDDRVNVRDQIREVPGYSPLVGCRNVLLLFLFQILVLVLRHPGCG